MLSKFFLSSLINPQLKPQLIHSSTPLIHFDAIPIPKIQIIFPSDKALLTTLVRKYCTLFFWWSAENYRMGFTCFYEYKICMKCSVLKGFLVLKKILLVAFCSSVKSAFLDCLGTYLYSLHSIHLFYDYVFFHFSASGNR
jgi:hypothetical protein